MVILHRMKSIAILFTVLILSASCKKESQPMTKAEMRKKIDSLTSIRLKELDAQANHDLEYRMKIEVKVKVDSIVQARMQQPGH